jgi:hypothetical protein
MEIAECLDEPQMLGLVHSGRFPSRQCSFDYLSLLAEFGNTAMELFGLAEPS